MLNTEEKRFIRYWEDQRRGGWKAYGLLYVLGGSVIISLLAFAILLLFIQVRLRPFMLWMVPASALILAFLLTAWSWKNNEGRWKKIIKREIKESS